MPFILKCEGFVKLLVTIFNRAKSVSWGGSMRKKENGFTLIELMVTIAVMAIIAMMAAPSMTSMIRKNQLHSDAREVIELATMARSNAVFSKKEQKLALDSSVTDGQLKWLPEEHTSWATKPVNSISYNMFGFLVSANDRECFILQHQKDTTQKAVIEFYKNGSIRYERSNSTCPN